MASNSDTVNTNRQLMYVGIELLKKKEYANALKAFYEAKPLNADYTLYLDGKISLCQNELAKETQNSLRGHGSKSLCHNTETTAGEGIDHKCYTIDKGASCKVSKDADIKSEEKYTGYNENKRQNRECCAAYDKSEFNKDIKGTGYNYSKINFEDLKKEADLEAAKQAEKAAKQAEKVTKQPKEAVKQAIIKRNNTQSTSVEEDKEACTLFETQYVVKEPVSKDTVNTWFNIAQGAFKERDFTTAEKFLLKAKRICPEPHIEKLQELEDTELEFQQTNDKRLNSRELYKIAENFYLMGKVDLAKKYLLKAKESYNSINVNLLLDRIENHRKSSRGTLEPSHIPEPSFVNLCSETHFSYHSGQEAIPSYHSNESSEKVEEFLKKARMALIKGNFEKAKEYALKCENLSPVRARGLMHCVSLIIDRTRKTKSTKEGDNQTKRLGKAEEHLMKANSLKQTIEAKLQGKVQDARYNSQFNYADVNDQPSTSYANAAKVNIERIRNYGLEAKKYYFDGDFDISKRLLQKANRMCPDGEVKTLIKKLESKIEEQTDPKMENAEHKSSESEQEENQKLHQEMRAEAMKCLDMAKEKYDKGDLDNAQSFAVLSQSFLPNDAARELLECIYHQKYLAENDNKTMKAYFFAQNAKLAIAYCDSQLATNYLTESMTILRTLKARKFLAEACTAFYRK